jgi:hypothetical protein
MALMLWLDGMMMMMMMTHISGYFVHLWHQGAHHAMHKS